MAMFFPYNIILCDIKSAKSIDADFFSLNFSYLIWKIKLEQLTY